MPVGEVVGAQKCGETTNGAGGGGGGGVSTAPFDLTGVVVGLGRVSGPKLATRAVTSGNTGSVGGVDGGAG
jgi:hypothetical protein